MRRASTTVADLARGYYAGCASNARWLGKVCAQLRYRAKAAQQTGPGSERAEMLKVAEELCEKEVRASPRPTMMPPLTLPELVSWAKTIGGIARVRVTTCFVLAQGQRADGTPKLRRIDNAKENGINAACRTVEAVTCISFMFPILIARAFVTAATASDVVCGARRLRCCCSPSSATGSDD